jgi:hypothetical protein
MAGGRRGGSSSVGEGWPAAIEDLAMLAQATNNDPVRLGAIRARLDAMAQRATLLRLGGYLPATRRAEMVEADIRRMGEDIFKAIEKHQVPDEVVEDLLEALDSPVGPSNGHGG